jgi:hypothetical protein
MVCQQLDEARPYPTRRVQGFGPATLQFALPFLSSVGIHLPPMGLANDRREKPGHCYRILTRQLFDFDLAVLGINSRTKTEFPSSFAASIRSPR